MCDAATGCYDNMCRTHFQNLNTAHRNQIGNIARDVKARSCFSYRDYATQSPIIGLGFAFLIMSFLIPIHTFSPMWIGQRHGGWLIAACVATFVAIYHVHVHYFGTTGVYEIIRHMVDCTGPDDLDGAYHMHKSLPPGYNCVAFNGAFSFDDIKKHLGVTMHHNPAAVEFAAMVAGFTTALVMATMSISITIFCTLGSPFLMEPMCCKDMSPENYPKA
jgi:hypothetical protein